MFVESNCSYIHTFNMNKRTARFEDWPFKKFSLLRHDFPLSKAQVYWYMILSDERKASKCRGH